MHTVMSPCQSHKSSGSLLYLSNVTFFQCSLSTAFPQNEHKEVKVDEILGREKAEEAIKDAMVRCCHLYKKSLVIGRVHLEVPPLGNIHTRPFNRQHSTHCYCVGQNQRTS